MHSDLQLRVRRLIDSLVSLLSPALGSAGGLNQFFLLIDPIGLLDLFTFGEQCISHMGAAFDQAFSYALTRVCCLEIKSMAQGIEVRRTDRLIDCLLSDFRLTIR
jgi:hypothetical protein